jgi:hypothetical protein
MRRDTARRVVATYDKIFREELGLSFAEGKDEMYEYTKRQLALWRRSNNPDKLTLLLIRSTPAPTPVCLPKLLYSIELLPYLLREVYEGETPKNRGGRPRLLTLQDDRETCEGIGQLLGKGADLPATLKRMALRKGVSLRSIQRVWYGRHNPSSPHFLGRVEKEGQGLRFRVRVMRRAAPPKSTL